MWLDPDTHSNTTDSDADTIVAFDHDASHYDAYDRDDVDNAADYPAYDD